MRKFKIKNRTKRKYVKKHDLAVSLSQTQSLTLGVIPMLLVVIAFLATFFIANPPLNQPVLPEIQIPEMSLPQISLPAIEIPQLKTPEIHLSFEWPKLPQIEIPHVSLPNPVPPIAAAFTSLGNGGSGIINSTLDGIDTFDKFFGQSLTFGIQQTAAVIGSTSSAILHGIGAFFWLLGTPFRYLGRVMNEFWVAIAPVIAFMNHAFLTALNQLKEGGSTLLHGVNEVSSTTSVRK
jgi:hypothetical protein